MTNVRRRFWKREEAPEFFEGQKYNEHDLELMADALLRADGKRETCRECGGVGEKTGESKLMPQYARDDDGNILGPMTDNRGRQLIVLFDELACKEEHTWYDGEGKAKGFKGSNQILFEEHMIARKRREIYCVDPDTECLTKEGRWTHYDNLHPGDSIMVFDPRTQMTKWEPLIDVYVNDLYEGEMISLRGNGLDALVTPDHRWPVYTIPKKNGRLDRDNPVIEVKTTDELNFSSKRALLLGAPYSGSPETPTFSDAFVRIIAWSFTEGHIWGRKTGPRIAITQNPDRYADQIRQDIISLGADFTHFEPGSNAGADGFIRREGLYCREAPLENGGLQFILSGTEVDPLIDALGYQKSLNLEFLCDLTADQIQIFIDIMILGDGTGTNTFYQFDKIRMDAACIVAVLGGYAPSLRDHNCKTGIVEFPNGYSSFIPEDYGIKGVCTLFGKSSCEPRKWLHRLTIRDRIPYSGTVWCPVTTSGHWLARRNGKVFITGNCEGGTPDPGIVSGMYNKTHPEGRRVNSAESRRKHGAAFYS